MITLFKYQSIFNCKIMAVEYFNNYFKCYEFYHFIEIHFNLVHLNSANKSYANDQCIQYIAESEYFEVKSF